MVLRLLFAVVALVARAPEEAAGDERGVSLDRHAVALSPAAGLDAHARAEKARRTLIEHLADRHPEEPHRAARGAPAVGKAVAVLAPRGAPGHVRADGALELLLREPTHFAHVAFPALGPSEHGYQR